MMADKSSHLFIFYDLEFCDGGYTSEIYQIGAKTHNSVFSSFILPTGSIDWGVTTYAGGVKIKADQNGKRQLYKNTDPIPSVCAEEGLKSFIEWIKGLRHNGKFKDVFLIAHGNTDMPALLNNLECVNLADELKSVVSYFVDSLQYFQSSFPDWEKHKISYMSEKLLGEEMNNEHDALADAWALYKIMERTKQDCDELFIQTLLKHAISVDEGYRISAMKVAKSMRKRKIKSHMSSNVKRFCAFPSDFVKNIDQNESVNAQSKTHPVSELIDGVLYLIVLIVWLIVFMESANLF